MSIDELYASIVDLRLSSDRTVAKLEAEALALRDGGDRAGANQLVGRALQGTAFMPHLKMRLRAFAERELGEDAADS